MDIEVYKTKQRITKSLLKQMPKGYNMLGKPYIVLGHVVNVIQDESHTAIFQSGDEYYTLPMDFVLLKQGVSCCRIFKGKKVEFKFDKYPGWWKEYENVVKKALQTHIYL